MPGVGSKVERCPAAVVRLVHVQAGLVQQTLHWRAGTAISKNGQAGRERSCRNPFQRLLVDGPAVTELGVADVGGDVQSLGGAQGGGLPQLFPQLLPPLLREVDTRLVRPGTGLGRHDSPK